jgi:hypothetical protein
MSNETAELPEPLLTAVRYAARLMANGAVGLASQGSRPYDYHSDAKRCRAEVLEEMRAEVERTTQGLRTLRLASETLHLHLPETSTLLHSVVICDISREAMEVVLTMWPTDTLYTIAVHRGKSHGVMVAKAAPNPRFVLRAEQ